MPDEQLAMIERVPVGAMVVTVALRRRGPSGLSYTEPSKLGNTPRCPASLTLASRPSASMKPMTFSPRATASSLS
jgi:hypothetical protein